MSVRACNLCGALEGTFHGVWTEYPEKPCPHIIGGLSSMESNPRWTVQQEVVFGPSGLVCPAKCLECKSNVEEGGECRCLPSVESRSFRSGLLTYPDGGLGPMIWKHPEANRERTAATASVSSRCSFCNAAVPSKRLRCSACGYRGDL